MGPTTGEWWGGEEWMWRFELSDLQVSLMRRPHLGAAIICETSIKYWVSSTHLSTGESVLVGKGVCLI